MSGRHPQSQSKPISESRHHPADTLHDADDLVTISSKTLIGLRHVAEAIPLDAGKIRALQTGQYQSPFKGRGMEFDEARLYQAGDDVRSIDWRVTARTGKPHTKLYREERERAVILCVDFRAPMFFATRGAFKSVIAAKLAGILSWSASHNGDRLGGLIFSESEHLEMRPQRGKLAVLHFLQRLTDHPAWQWQSAQNNSHKTPQKKEANTHSAMQQALGRLRRVARPGSLIVMISDFRDMDQHTHASLSQLSRHNDVILVFVYDSLESQLPPAGFYRLGDEETVTSIDTSISNIRERYRNRFEERIKSIDTLCKRYRMRFITCATHENVAEVLQQGFGLKARAATPSYKR